VNRGLSTTLSVKILSIEPTRDFAVSAFIPCFGRLTNAANSGLDEALSEKTLIHRIRDRKTYLENGVTIPYKPFFGTTGAVPEVQSVNSLTPGSFFHRRRSCSSGDGELCSVACEIPTKAIVTLDLIKRKTIRLPRILSKELISSMVEGYGYEKFEAYQLLTQVGVMRVGNMVGPNYSLVARCPTDYFKKRK